MQFALRQDIRRATNLESLSPGASRTVHVLPDEAHDHAVSLAAHRSHGQHAVAPNTHCSPFPHSLVVGILRDLVHERRGGAPVLGGQGLVDPSLRVIPRRHLRAAVAGPFACLTAATKRSEAICELRRRFRSGKSAAGDSHFVQGALDLVEGQVHEGIAGWRGWLRSVPERARRWN